MNDGKHFSELRNGPTGINLTNTQVSEAYAITGIVLDGIYKTGRFAEKLTDFSHAMARTERFSQLKAETIVRELFEERYGVGMNALRVTLMDNEANPPTHAHECALEQAKRIETMISEGDRPFYRAYDAAAHTVSEQLNITEIGAKNLMKDAFREAEGRELYDAGKVWEKEFRAPKHEAPRQTRETAYERLPSRSMQL